MFSRFFIERPVLANVIAIITMLMGGVALWYLPVEQYPEITPPTVRVSTMYPGANADVVAKTVASPIEQQVNGVENMLYMSSTCSSDGSYSLNVTFEIGTDLDQAQVLVQNRVAVAEPLLPEEVKRQGLTIKKQSTNIILVISLMGAKGSDFDTLFLANYATLRLRDELMRINGVGEVTVFGTANYAMRIWIDPEKLKSRNMTVEDVIAAVREQNVQVAAGQVGQPPIPSENEFQYTVTTMGRLTEASQFENIVVKTNPADNGLTYLKDVARVELGSQSYDQFTQKKGVPNANIGIYQLPGANALNVADEVKKAMARMALKFPAGMEYNFPLDTTKFVEQSIHEVYKTLIEAGLLVLVVILVFLQDWRAVLVPATTVPVTIIGAFAALAALGFSINMLTLFALILAIGIVVDDAIVIVENAVHHIEEGLPPKAATIKAMDEVLGPIIGITLVLMAVFIPAATLGGITGQLYRQFALTIAATAFISAINALTLKPAQCGSWLRPIDHTRKKNWFFRGFDAVYNLVERIYAATVRRLVKHVFIGMLLFLGLVGAAAWGYASLPTGFFPEEDQGYAFIIVQLPDAASQQRTREVTDEINNRLSKMVGVDDWFIIGGLSLLDFSSASNSATIFVIFKDWGEREPKGQDLKFMVNQLRGGLMPIQEAFVMAFAPPAIRGLGVRNGFEMQVQDRADVGLLALYQAATGIMEAANGQTALMGVSTTFRPGVPQLYVDIDRVKVKSLEVSLSAVFGTLQASLGAVYINDINLYGRTYQVRVQADAPFRENIEDIGQLEVRNRRGQMVPLSSVASVRRSFGPQVINRFNMYPTAAVTGAPAPRYSSGEALRIMEQLANANLPDTMGFEWAGMAFQEKRIGGEAFFVFGMAVLLVYLCLAGQYESWIVPFAIILVVPLGLLGAVIAVAVRGMDNNIYTQIGIVLIIALASKNAILIVEFAREIRKKGRSVREAAVEAAQLRFRPILMTSFAFILGVSPLVWATGAGAGGQRALGTAVFGGMIAATVLAVFFVPIFFVLCQWIDEWWVGRRERSLAHQREIDERILHDHQLAHSHDHDHTPSQDTHAQPSEGTATS